MAFCCGRANGGHELLVARIAPGRRLGQVLREPELSALRTQEVAGQGDPRGAQGPKMQVIARPEYTRMVAGSGKVLKIGKPGLQKLWSPANFKLEIDGLDTYYTGQIDPLTMRLKLINNADGTVTPVCSFSDLRVFKIQVADLPPLNDWFTDFVINGNNGDDLERGGTLTYLAPDGTTVLGQVTFSHLGIFSLVPDHAGLPSNVDVRWNVELYCEGMAVNYNGFGK